MGRFDGILLLSDFDGTLAYQRTISPENCEAIRYFQSEGGLFAPASGRAPTWFAQWSDYFVPNTFYAAFNGAVICSPDGTPHVTQPICDDFLSVAEDFLAISPEIEWVNFFTCYDYHRIDTREQKPTDLTFSEPVYKMIFGLPTDKSDEIYARACAAIDSRYIKTRSWINGLEVQRTGTGKGDALLRIKSLLGDRVRLTVAAGDFENDIALLQAADIGYAVANAVPELKAVADRITVDCSQSAIARIIGEL